jgi:N-acetylmuramoyl-L-alanine amidase
MTCLRALRDRPSATAAAVLAALWILCGPARPFSQAQGAGTYTIYSTEGRRPLAVRTSGPNDVLVFSLTQITGLFGLKFTEDLAAGGLMIETRGERIVAVPGQSFVQVAGKVISLDGPVERDQKTWLVPLDFLSKALGPAVGQPVVIRRPSKLILGDLRVPQITGRVERTATGGRVTIEAQPPAPHKIAREGNRLVIRFDAAALRRRPLPAPCRTSSPACASTADIAIGLGTSPRRFARRCRSRADDHRVAAAATATGAATHPAGRDGWPVGRAVDPGTITPPDKATAPLLDISTGQLRTVVIDAGHGGTDMGAKGASGAMEKDIALDVAKRLKTAIESRLGLRVLLTRDTDRDVTIDERSSVANNNKADLFVSLHLNASWPICGACRPSLDADEHPSRRSIPGSRPCWDRRRTHRRRGAVGARAGAVRRAVGPIRRRARGSSEREERAAPSEGDRLRTDAHPREREHAGGAHRARVPVEQPGRGRAGQRHARRGGHRRHRRGPRGRAPEPGSAAGTGPR